MQNDQEGKWLFFLLPPAQLTFSLWERVWQGIYRAGKKAEVSPLEKCNGPAEKTCTGIS